MSNRGRRGGRHYRWPWRCNCRRMSRNYGSGRHGHRWRRRWGRGYRDTLKACRLGRGVFCDFLSVGLSLRRSFRFGQVPKMLANFLGSGQFNGAGMRLFFGDASLGQIINDRLGLDLQVTCEFIDSNLIRVCHLPRDLLFLAILVRAVRLGAACSDISRVDTTRFGII
jgi:hypothetical protein